ncbi:MAG: NAD(P)H-dependent flavin oxidoreductase [Candidatus Hodarchaeales archaeon]|jgi:nitronate monooxygenase
MLQTKVTEMLKIRYPIIAGTMMNITDPQFVAACSNAGGLGILASAMYQSPDDLRTAIQETQSLTDKPFAVNVNLFPMLQPVNQLDYINVIIDEGITVIETSGHKAPEEYIPIFKEAGAIWIHKCAGVRYAKTAARLGADMVTVVGYENGGATGRLDIGTLVMIPSVVDAVDIPVIGGGGISDGRGLIAALALGAGAVILGTRMMATTECPIHANLKQEFIKATESDTVLIMRSVGATHRVWNNQAAQNVLELETKKAEPGDIFQAAAGAIAKEMYETGETGLGIVSCGQGTGLIYDIVPVQELFDRIMKEAETICRGLSRLDDYSI